MDKFTSGTCLDCNNCLVCETYQTWIDLDEDWLNSFADGESCLPNEILVVQVIDRNPHNRKASNVSNSHPNIIQLALSSFFSFGISRDKVYTMPFERRMNLYILVIMFWLIIGLSIGLIIGLKTFCVFWGLLSFIGFFTLSYGGFQMLDFESKNLQFYRYHQNGNGVWELNRITNIDNMYKRNYLEYLLPFLFFFKRIKFLYSLTRCNSVIKETISNRISQYLNHSVTNSECSFAIVNGSLYRISPDNNH